MNNPNAAALALQSNTQPPASNTLSTPAATQIAMHTQSQPQTQSANHQPQQNTVPQDAADKTNQSHTTLYPHQITGDGGPTATAPFLRDFSLVAEAAKRAQVAIVTRDLEGVSLQT